MIPTEPATRSDYVKLARLASAYVSVEPDKGFRILEKLIMKSTEISNASALVNGFQEENISVRKGEILLVNNSYQLSILNIQLKDFANFNLSRTLKIISRIKRPDLRINLELQALESTETPRFY